ncbi:CorA family divalent cation transporter [Nitrogeniibacter mangrovi]|uniref:CorA family divalent cation transporter n=1 Tax=Nitrogeniibacter mangrovi TaxID=2016596 RepID=UPI001E55672F|nr:CorA family divalent cation transporter [Nitrogeniibacter mangrovi]
MEDTQASDARRLGHFRQILLWPLQLMPLREGSQIHRHWAWLEEARPDNPWREVDDEFTDDPAGFQQRHYSEFVTFLPHVQRFLYGEGRTRGGAPGESPIRVFRRRDVARVRCTYPGDALAPAEFDIAHIDLYFFFDLDIAVLNVELHGDDISLDCAQETLFRLGRAYPTYWESNGDPGHCLKRTEWLDADGRVLATSDDEQRHAFLQHVSRYRAPRVAAHWDFLLQPLVPHHSDRSGPLRYRQLEYHRMPVMAYAAVDGDPRDLDASDFVRLGLITASGPPGRMPVRVPDFEQRFCYDRFWVPQAGGTPGSRYMGCGESFVLVGSARVPYFYTPGGSLLEEFRHQYFLLFLIPHMHKAALLMMSDRLVYALKRLDIQDPETIKRFKREIRQLREIFLRFTHRYWFHRVSDQIQARDLYRKTAEFLATEELYEEVRQRVQDMAEYLEEDTGRRQANTVLRLTVVTAFGLIGTTVTGYFGMNILELDGLSPVARTLYFLVIFAGMTWLTFYTVMKSKGLSDFLDALSDERVSIGRKLGALLGVWRRPRG